MTKKTPAILLPKNFDLDKAYAVQRLMDDKNHTVAMEYIINEICETYKDPTDTESPHLTYKNIGRSCVGRDIVTIYKLNLSKVKDMLQKERKK